MGRERRRARLSAFRARADAVPDPAAPKRRGRGAGDPGPATELSVALGTTDLVATSSAAERSALSPRPSGGGRRRPRTSCRRAGAGSVQRTWSTSVPPTRRDPDPGPQGAGGEARGPPHGVDGAELQAAPQVVLNCRGQPPHQQAAKPLLGLTAPAERAPRRGAPLLG